MKGPMNERLIGKPRETLALHNLPKQPPSADGGISPVRWGSLWNCEGAVLIIHYSISNVRLSSTIYSHFMSFIVLHCQIKFPGTLFLYFYFNRLN